MRPSRPLCIVILLAFAYPYGIIQATGAQSQDEVLTNNTIVEMTRAGFSPALIISKIRTSRTNFNTSTAELLRLKRLRVADEVLDAMVQAVSETRPPPQPPVATRAEPPAPARSEPDPPSKRQMPLPKDKGAYLWEGQELHLLYQTSITSLGENFWRKMTPFVKKKIEMQLMGARAAVSYTHPQPTIVVSGLGDVIPGIPAFRWLYVKSGGMLKDRRIVGTYDVGGFFGSVALVDNEIKCDVKKLAEGVYAITPVKPLQDGEYGLVRVEKLADVSNKPGFAPPVWDFGIYAEGPHSNRFP
jgi:hypothetical protein